LIKFCSQIQSFIAVFQEGSRLKAGRDSGFINRRWCRLRDAKKIRCRMPDGQLSDGISAFPPETEEGQLDWLRLIRSRRVGAVTFHRLLAEHGSAKAALAALPAIASAAGIERYTACPVEVAKAEMAAARKAGAVLLCFGSKDYPTALRDLPDAPPLLWAQGDIGLLNRPMVAMVGARNASSLGLRMARRLSEGLAEAGFVIVSGLARGIDAEAHAAAMETGTVAVQAGGVDVIYPAENAALAAEIAKRGCRISEQPFGMEPQARHFPLRNRIVSGLSRAVIVVEAAARSGSLITARNALDQGREVLSVPGHPFDARAAGCNMLIRDGATLIRNTADVLEAIGAVDRHPARASAEMIIPPAPPQRQNSATDAASLRAAILTRLGPSPTAEDQLLRDLALPAAVITPELLALELEGSVTRQPGGLLCRLH
jgi:DNA processing protein